jgi:hypothetical protein
MGCKRKIENYCKERAFVPSRNVYEARIKELQAQLSNSMVILDEKEFIKTMKNRLEGWNGKIQKIDNTILEIAKSKTQECNNWFNTHQNKKKTEQTLKNLEGNLNNEQ